MRAGDMQNAFSQAGVVNQLKNLALADWVLPSRSRSDPQSRRRGCPTSQPNKEWQNRLRALLRSSVLAVLNKPDRFAG